MMKSNNKANDKFDAIRDSGMKKSRAGKLKRNNSSASLYADPKGAVPVWGFGLPNENLDVSPKTPLMKRTGS